ncbi:MAG TPA: ATP-binding protein, partial [Herpetosiphonaceae bacterium]
ADGAAEQLAAAFVAALGRRAWRPFQLALGQIVQRSGAAGDDAHAWQAALSVLRALLPGLCADDEALLDQAREALDQARVAISAEVQRQLRQRLIDEVSTTDQVGLLTARLLAALDDEQISQALETYLPGAAIGWAALGRFAPEDDDPAAWSELRLVAGDPHGLPGAAGRFRSRAFPPPELPLPGAACQLAVFPLVIEGRSEGFMAFESANLELCAAIVRQVAAAFRNVRLHRAALEGRRLAEEADRLKSHFLSMVSHELRTPLHLMIQLSGLTLDLPGEASLSRQDLARLQASARHLDSLIRDVLDLATSDVGQLTFRPELINPREALQGAALAGEQLAAAKGLAWSAALPADLPPIWVDPARLRQIALNLISNAVKFTERGAVRLEVAAGAELTISVSDTGPGVPAGEQQAIFAAFRQSDRTSGRGHGGLGLGLAICQRLAAMHGGAVSVQSPGPGGVGSVFRVALPLAQPAGAGSAPTSAEADPADAEPPAADAGLETVILIAEDEPGMRDVHVRMINAYAPEYRLLTAPDGRAALELIRRDPPDLILLDLMLPELDGFAVLEALRGEELLRSIPVIVMTAQILTEAAMARLGQGVVSVLGKGVFNAQETLAHIEAALNRKRKPGGSAQRLVRKAMAFMHARYADEGLGVADIAGHVNINEDYLARCFRQETGLTPMAYLNRYRVNQAKALLAAGAASILEVALGVGFSDSSYFSQVFRREVGMSPRTYRQRNA